MGNTASNNPVGRVLLFIAIGVAMGAAGGYFFAQDRRGSVSLSSADPTADVPSFAIDTELGDAVAEQLPDVIRDNAGASRYELGRLLGRYADEDPAAAIELASELGLSDTAIAPLYARWARLDTASALRAWGNVEDPRTAARVAAAMMPALGGDGAALSLLLEARPAALDSHRLTVEVVAAVAEEEPATAVAILESIDNRATRVTASKQLATVWGSRDPESALAYAEALEDPGQRYAFKKNALLAWAGWESGAVLEYLGSQPLAGQALWMQGLGDVLQDVAQTDPFAALAFAERQSGQTSQLVRSVAIASLANQDIEAALAYIDRMPIAQRNDLYQSIASQYGAADPEGAIAWAENLGNPRIINSVLSALPDTSRALRELTQRGDVHQYGGLHMLAMRAASGPNPQAFGVELLGIENQDIKRQAISAFAQMWMNIDADTALDWLFENGQEFPETFSQVASNLAQLDPKKAMAMTSRVPEAAREQWVQQVASHYAMSDPEGALAWAQQYQGQPVYDAIVAQVVQQQAQSDPARAAALIGTIDSQAHAMNAIRGVAINWGQQNGAAAANWAESFGDQQTRDVAVVTVAQGWANSDPSGARRWILSLEAGRARDQALGALVQSSSRTGSVDQAVLDAFDDDMARQQAVLNVVFRVAHRDAESAQQLINEYINDPGLRSQADQVLNNAPRIYNRSFGAIAIPSN